MTVEKSLLLLSLTFLIGNQSKSQEVQNNEPKNLEKLEEKSPTSQSDASIEEGKEEHLNFVERQSIKLGKDSISLINLNSYINKWLILIREGELNSSIHLENVDIENKVFISELGLYIVGKDNKSRFCDLWNPSTLDIWAVDFENYNFPFYKICEGLIYIRLKKESNTKLSLTELTTEWLRGLKYGEEVVNFIKPFLVNLKIETDVGVANSKKAINNQKEHFPYPPKLKIDSKNVVVSAGHKLGIEVKNESNEILFGRWYETKMHDGIFTNIMKPNLINPNIMTEHEGRLNELADREKNALIYITAYDLDMYTAKYVLGTKHPDIDMNVKTNQYIAPIGSIPPYDVTHSVSVFIGGFKSRHGYFKYGPYQGRIYGYIEGGTEIQKMEPDLATIYLGANEEIEIIKWPKDENEERRLRQNIITARQNGALIIDNKVPGSTVSSWSNGNWSGSSEGNLVSLRSGICIQKKENKNFLLFMAFYGVAPSTMARTMIGFQCKDGMHLDMNAHMYLHNAIYKFIDGQYQVEYLHQEMLYPKDLKIHRFIMDNNQRDFFYLKKRSKYVE